MTLGTKCARKFCAHVQYSLGSLYYRGLGVEQDYQAALELYSKSAAQGNAYADYELAKMYRPCQGRIDIDMGS